MQCCRKSIFVFTSPKKIQARTLSWEIADFIVLWSEYPQSHFSDVNLGTVDAKFGSNAVSNVQYSCTSPRKLVNRRILIYSPDYG